MMSLYAQYIKERAGIEIIESERGFMSFQIQGKECFIYDAYVCSEYRLSGEGAGMLGALKTLAQSQGCDAITATIWPGAKNSTESMAAMIHVGFKITSSAPNLIALKMEIK